MNSGQACRPCRGSCSLIPGRGCFGDLPGDKIVVSPPSSIVESFKRPDHRMTSYNRALEITRCESIETTLKTRRLLWAGTLLRMSGGRQPKQIVFGNLKCAVRRGRGGKQEELTDCVQSDIRAFGIAGDRNATALRAEVWVQTAAEGGRRFMAAWRKEEVQPCPWDNSV